MADPAEMFLFQALRNMPENRRAEMQMSYHSQRKDRTVALLLGFFLGGLGVDRFYIGDVGLGVAKLCLNWATCFTWQLVDLFLIMGAADRHNMRLITQLEAMHQAP